MSGNYTSIDNQSVSGSVPAVSIQFHIYIHIHTQIQIHPLHQSCLILQAVPDPGHLSVKFQGEIHFLSYYFVELLSFCLFAVKLKEKKTKRNLDMDIISWSLLHNYVLHFREDSSGLSFFSVFCVSGVLGVGRDQDLEF